MIESRAVITPMFGESHAARIRRCNLLDDQLRPLAVGCRPASAADMDWQARPQRTSLNDVQVSTSSVPNRQEAWERPPSSFWTFLVLNVLDASLPGYGDWILYRARTRCDALARVHA
ncbi:MAG TPA: hypothetical protein VER04_23480 [Polyangiaceae bacterium]|nr:hypothetical protein [Polyangiaceae bacterium]